MPAGIILRIFPMEITRSPLRRTVSLPRRRVRSPSLPAKTTTSNITLVPNAGATVNAGADKTDQAFGAAVPLSATVEVYDPRLTGTPTFLWKQVADPTLPPTASPPGTPVLPLATITGDTTATPTVTLANRGTFKDNLVRANAVRTGVVEEEIPPEVPGESPATHEKPIMASS